MTRRTWQLFSWWKRWPRRVLRCSAWDSHVDWDVLEGDGSSSFYWLGHCPCCGHCVEIFR